MDEESTKSDEEYDDLAMQDIQENGCWSDDDEFKDKVVPISGEEPTSNVPYKDKQDPDCFLRTKIEPLPELQCSYSSLLKEKNEKIISSSGSHRLRRRSHSIPAFGKHGSLTKGPILSGAPQR